MNEFIKSCGKWFEYYASITNNTVKTPVVAGIALEKNSLSKAFFFIRANNNVISCFAINCFFKYLISNSTLSVGLFNFNNSCVDIEFPSEKDCQIIAGQIGVCTHISQLGNERFHEENLAFITKYSSRKLNLLKNKEVTPYMPLGENLDARNTWIKRTDYQNLCYYTSLGTLPILIYTWNIAQRSPEESTFESAKHIFQTDALLIALVLQEIDFSAKAVILGGSELRQKWNETFDKASRDNGYETLFEDSLGGVFVRYMRKKDFPFSIEIANRETIRLGLGGMTANKSAIITKFRISNATFAFVGCHLTPHNPNYEERNQQMIELLNRLNAMGEADYTIIFGDLNYRVDLPYDQAVNLCSKGDIKTLLENEQLGRFLSTEPLFKDFHEQKIDFLPTYKFDNGTNIYDTSKKLRVPSWTDRILFKVGKKRTSVGPTDALKFETDVLRDTDLPIDFSGPSYFSIEDPPKNYPLDPIFIEYKSYPDIIFSDHRPVQSYVKFPIPLINQERLKTFRMIQMKRLDEINSLSIPKCKVVPPRIEKTGITKITLTNTSFNSVEWKNGFIPKGVTVDPASGKILPSMTQEISIKVDEFTPESQFVTIDIKGGSPITIEFPNSKSKTAAKTEATVNVAQTEGKETNTTPTANNLPNATQVSNNDTNITPTTNNEANVTSAINNDTNAIPKINNNDTNTTQVSNNDTNAIPTTNNDTNAIPTANNDTNTTQVSNNEINVTSTVNNDVQVNNDANSTVSNETDSNEPKTDELKTTVNNESLNEPDKLNANSTVTNNENSNEVNKDSPATESSNTDSNVPANDGIKDDVSTNNDDKNKNEESGNTPNSNDVNNANDLLEKQTNE